MGAADSQDKAAGAPEDCGGGLYAMRVPPTDAVKRRQSIRRVKFGTTDLVVSELCAGTMTWGSRRRRRTTWLTARGSAR